MDPGLGLIVNTIVPTEVDVPKLPPSSSLKLPDGFLVKPHVRHALKYMTDDAQREKALEVAMAWKKKFAADSWRPVIAAIETASNEDNLTSLPHDARPQPSTQVDDAEQGRNTHINSPASMSRPPLQSASALTELTSADVSITSLSPKCPPAEMTPRNLGWDFSTSGMATPLTAIPIVNPSSGNNSWNTSAPQSTHSASSEPSTTEVLQLSPPQDEAAREIYERVKFDIESLAHKYSLVRNNKRSFGTNAFTTSAENRSKDLREAAQLVLNSRKVNLKNTIIKDLPERLHNRALDEAALRSRIGIINELELYKRKLWTNDKTEDSTNRSPGPAHLAVSILDEQREALRIFRRQHKGSDLHLDDVALDAAWAVKILEDAERLAAAEADGRSGNGDEDDGYSYDNFMRSIRSEMSTSSNSGALATMVDELSNSNPASLLLRANTNQIFDSMKSGEHRITHPSSISSSNEDRRSTRFKEMTISNGSHEHIVSLQQRRDLRIVTEIVDEVPNAELSPQDRESRHWGSSLADVDYWIAELKKMDAMRAHRKQLSASLRRTPDSSGGPSSSIKQISENNTTVHITPIKQLHSRFSSWSSNSSIPLEPLSCPLTHLPQSSLSMPRGQSQHNTLDCACPSPKNNHASNHTHHIRPQDTVYITRTTREAEDEWICELQRMESREKFRQKQERRRKS